MATPTKIVQESGSFDSSKLYVWVKSLESKANSLLREVDLVKNDSIKKSSELKKQIKLMGDEVLEVKRQQELMRRQMDLIVKELKQTAGKEEIMVLRKYVDYWNPLTFVTQRDVERVVTAKLGERGRVESERGKKEVVEGASLGLQQKT